MQYRIDEDGDGSWCVEETGSGSPAPLVFGYAVGLSRQAASDLCMQLSAAPLPPATDRA